MRGPLPQEPRGDRAMKNKSKKLLVGLSAAAAAAAAAAALHAARSQKKKAALHARPQKEKAALHARPQKEKAALKAAAEAEKAAASEPPAQTPPAETPEMALAAIAEKPEADADCGDESKDDGPEEKRGAGRVITRVLTVLAFAAVFLIGLCVLLYPRMSNYINEKNQSRAIDIYEDALVPLSAADYDKYLADAQAYNRRLAESGISIGEAIENAIDGRDAAGDYNSLLNVTGDGMMGYIVIDKTGVSLPIFHGTEETTLEDGAGHTEGSSLPVSGESVHAVVSAHTGLPSSKLFTDLDQLAEGDTFEMHVLDRVYTYQVDQILTVLPSEVDSLGIEDGKNYVTLVTCTPYGVNSHRLLVRGALVSDEPAAKDGSGDGAQQQTASASESSSPTSRASNSALVFASGVFESAVTGLVKAEEWVMNFFGVKY